MKKQRILLLLILPLLIFIISSSIHVNADMGPKASVSVNLKGLTTKEYTATLVAKTAFGPNYTYEDWLEWGDDDYQPYHQIMEYQDEEGFMWIGTHWTLDGDASFSWNYYPPQEFKIIILTSDETLYSSQILKRYAFHSYYDFDISQKESHIDGSYLVMAVKSYNYGREVLSFLLRLIATILIEIGLLFLFGYRRWSSFKIVLFVNIITQLILNLVLNIVGFYQSALIGILIYAFLEIFIFIGESIYYYYSLKEKSRLRAILYGMLANLLSFGFGLGLYLLFL